MLKSIGLFLLFLLHGINSEGRLMNSKYRLSTGFIHPGFQRQYASRDTLQDYRWKNKKRPPKIMLKFSSGFNMPITKLLNGSNGDNLMQYADQSYYWQIISVSYYFWRNWGVEFYYKGSTAPYIHKRMDRFYDEINNTYQNLYYIIKERLAFDIEFNPIGGHMANGFLGAVRRFQIHRWIIVPKLFFGGTAFKTDLGITYLKEKNTNNFLALTYDTDYKNKFFYTGAAALAIGCKLKKRLIVNLDLQLSYYKADIDFTEKLTHLVTQQVIHQKLYAYHKNIFTFSTGIGFIITIR